MSNEVLTKVGNKAEWAPASGGSADWNVNDPNAPGYVKNRPFYAGDPVKSVLVPETTLDYTETTSLTGPFACKLVDGETYTVIYDGVNYECKASTVSGGGMSMVAIGNGAAIGTEDSGEPFLIADSMGTIITMDTSGAEGSAHTISIEGLKWDIHTLPIEFLPVSIVTGSKSFDGTVTCSHTLSEIMEMLDKGLNVFMKYSDTSGYVAYFPAMINAFGGVTFMGLMGQYGTSIRTLFSIKVKDEGCECSITSVTLGTTKVSELEVESEGIFSPKIILTNRDKEAGTSISQWIEFTDDKEGLRFVNTEALVINDANGNKYKLHIENGSLACTAL